MPHKNLTEQITQNGGHIATAAAGGSGLISYVAENSAIIGLAISLTSLIVGLGFYILNYQLSKRRTRLLEEKVRNQIRKEVIDELFTDVGDKLPEHPAMNRASNHDLK